MITNPRELGRKMERLCRDLPSGVRIHWCENPERFCIDFDNKKESIPLAFTGDESYAEIRDAVFSKLN